MKADTSIWSTRNSLPELKQNQPNHNNAVPRATRVMLCGWPCLTVRWPMKSTEAMEAKPAVLCTTTPPAKSSTPHLAIMPSGAQIMWTKG